MGLLLALSQAKAILGAIGGSFRTYWSLLIWGWFIGGVAVVVLWMEGMKLRVLKQEPGVLQRCPARASLRVPRDTKTGIDFDKPSCISQTSHKVAEGKCAEAEYSSLFSQKFRL